MSTDRKAASATHETLKSAVDRFREVVRLDPSHVKGHIALGTALQSLGHLAEAKECYRRALALQPAELTARFNLATALHTESNYAEAEVLYRAVLTVASDHVESLQGLGQCAQVQGRHREAVASYEAAIARNPSSAQLHYYLGTAWQAVGESDKAAASYREALRLDPRHIDAMLSLGAAVQNVGLLDEAKALYRRVLELKPGDSTAQLNLGSVLYAQARYAEAEAAYRAAMGVPGNHVGALCGLSKACLMQGNLAAARLAAEQARRANPDDLDARLMHGTILLTLGDWPPGWRDLKYCLQQKEYCLQLTAADHRSSSSHIWEGSPLGVRTMLVHGEYGLGDTLHFIRYLPLVRERTPEGRLLVGVHPKLIPLLAESGFEELIALDGPLPPFDVRIGMMSLPAIFETTLDTVPGTEPYIAANARLIEQWRQRLSDIEGLRVGIHWQGDSTFLPDRHRSIPLANFAPLAQVPRVTLISLQMGSGAGQIATVAGQFPVVALEGLDEQGGAFMDTAAVMENLDLVITSDTATAHLAGALGVRVWIALSAAPDWRWMVDRDDSPWYPSARLFRQKKLDNWSDVFVRMAGELTALAAG